MANLKVRRSDSAEVFLKASGVGTDGDPHVPEHLANVAIPAAIYHGKTVVATAGTQVVLSASQAILSGVTVKALAANLGIIYVGASAVSSADGFELAAGEQIFVEVANLATVWVDASVSGESVTWIAS